MSDDDLRSRFTGKTNSTRARRLTAMHLPTTEAHEAAAVAAMEAAQEDAVTAVRAAGARADDDGPTVVRSELEMNEVWMKAHPDLAIESVLEFVRAHPGGCTVTEGLGRSHLTLTWALRSGEDTP